MHTLLRVDVLHFLNLRAGESMSEENRIHSLKQRKQRLDLKISDEEKRPSPDEVALHRLKAQKLTINDELLELSN